uniref:Platelet-derived growth factor (PDGF) family profile domain-containing protein n=1 Tax=Daphnia galeata TaxID=27404 RepID=A0A8J2RFG5_9CRUS|nr:unnamed protein product [Daphnia galeata]
MADFLKSANIKLVKLLCFWLLLASPLLANPNPSTSAVKTIPLNKNLRAFNDWTCNKPQPRVVHIENLDDYVAPNVIYLPSALIIHQCDQSTGCCKTPGQICKSVETAEEKVQFAVRAISNSGSGGGDSPSTNAPVKNNKRIISNGTKRPKNEKKMMITLTNHTRCECVGKVDLRV